jgi:hypothetical protein
VHKIHVLLQISFFAVAAAFAQDAPTGIVIGGGFSLIHTETKASTPPTPPAELFSGGFISTDYSKVPPFTQPDITTIDPCTIVTLRPTPPVTFDPTASKPLDAGPAVTLTGPNGTKTFKANKFAYGGLLADSIYIPLPGAPPPPPPWLDAGTYTLDNGDGGADIGPFKVSLTVASPLFKWANIDDISTVDRAAGVDVVWSGGDPADKVFINGGVTLFDAGFKVSGGASFSCIVDNSAGHFTVTSDVLGLLPASPAASLIPTSTLTVGTTVTTKFDAPGSDGSQFSFNAGGSRSVTYK